MTCSTYKQCPIPYPLAGTELNFAYSGYGPNDLGVSFCRGRYPSVRFSLCVDIKYSANPYWSRQGRACRRGNTGSDSFPWTPWYAPTLEVWTPWYAPNPKIFTAWYRQTTERSWSDQRTVTTNHWKLPTTRARRVDFDWQPCNFPRGPYFSRASKIARAIYHLLLRRV